MSEKITPEVIEALRTLRKIAWGGDIEDAINVLDNAGVFAAIDEATGYDINPTRKPDRYKLLPKRDWQEHMRAMSITDARALLVNEPQAAVDRGMAERIPGDPAEWGDAAFVDDRTNHASNVGAPWGRQGR